MFAVSFIYNGLIYTEFEEVPNRVFAEFNNIMVLDLMNFTLLKTSVGV